MTWQTAIILQVVVSALMTIFTRQLTLSTKKVFFGVGVLSYITIAIVGMAYASFHTDVLSVPPATLWPYLLIEGICIPASWLIIYKLISGVGAGNASIITTVNVLGTALMGIAFLNEQLTAAFLIGSVLVLSGVILSLKLRPDKTHKSSMTFRHKLGLTLGGALLYSIGMYAEKVAVTDIGVWDYALFGWSMQAVGAIVLLCLFGRKEIEHIDRKIAIKGITLGAITSLSGLLYIYALSKGTLSQTIIAASGKTVLVMILAAIFLNERNAIGVRISAFILTMFGLWFVLS